MDATERHLKTLRYLLEVAIARRDLVAKIGLEKRIAAIELGRKASA